MNVLITGYKGFIGKRIDGKPFVGDVRNIKELIGQSKKVDGIVHLAAVSNWRDCKNNPVKCVTTNILGLCNVLEVAKKRKIWVLFISTFQIRKNTLYGLTKLTGEELCRVYQNQGVKIKIMRLPIVYGPDDKSHKIVTKMISMLTDGRKVNIDTDDKFNFLYVDDAARIIENEMDIIQGGFGKKYTLYELVDGIKKCIKQNVGEQKTKK